MKTTINIADGILTKAKELTKQENITLTEVMELSLRDFLLGYKQSRSKFKLQKSHFGKQGLVDELKHKDWSEIRDLSYELTK